MENLILASASPRRKEILEQYNIYPKIVSSEIKEKIDSTNSPEQIAMSLAFQKAYSVSLSYKDSIVLGADTIVVYKNEILGKPKDKDDAFRILSLLNGQEHTVMTGIAIIDHEKNIKIVDYEKTTVKFIEYNKSIIDKYIDSKEPFGKAGAYAIQGYGALLVEKIEGCYLNVVGLPLSKFNYLMDKYFNINII